MFDASIGGGQHAFKVIISDLTTGQSGFMVASATNGFMNTSMFDCSGHPFNFQPLFNTARVQNSIGWSVLLSGILTQYEIGHFTPCSRITNPIGSGAGKSGRTATAPTRTRGRPMALSRRPGADRCAVLSDGSRRRDHAPDQATGCIVNATSTSTALLTAPTGRPR